MSFDQSAAPGYAIIRSWLSQRCGICYPEQKLELLIHRLSRVVERFELSGVNELADHVTRGDRHDIQLAVMHAASTNHTFFFREPQVLDFFRDTILPGLSQRNEANIWSAAASTGDEAYTLAMIAAEAWGAGLAAARLSILGTDISEPVVAQAESGVYAANHVEQMPDDLRDKYMHLHGIDQYRVNPAIRSMCTFRRLNLKSQPYPFSKSFAVVFCRNVLYYFDKDDQVRVLEALYDVTEPGGWLLTSVTESVRGRGTRWTPVDIGICRRPP
jgi:chemotaxis protein methyltransferase CheR